MMANQRDKRRGEKQPQYTPRQMLEIATTPTLLSEFLARLNIAENMPVTDTNASVANARFRIEVVDGEITILCPIPLFYDESMHVETGFAVVIQECELVVRPFAFDEVGQKYQIIWDCGIPYNDNYHDRDGWNDHGQYKPKQLRGEEYAVLFINGVAMDVVNGMRLTVETLMESNYLSLLELSLDRFHPPFQNRAMFSQYLNAMLDAVDKTGRDGREGELRIVLDRLLNFLFGMDTYEHSYPGFMDHVDAKLLVGRKNLLYDQLLHGKAPFLEFETQVQKAIYLGSITDTKPADQEISKERLDDIESLVTLDTWNALIKWLGE